MRALSAVLWTVVLVFSRVCVLLHSNRGTGGLTTSGGSRGPLITPAPPRTTVKCFDGRWPQHAKQAAPQWNAAHGSTRWWCTAPDAAATHQCDHRVGEGCVIMYCMAPSPWRLNTNTTTVGPCSATLVRAGHGARHGHPLCASVGTTLAPQRPWQCARPTVA